MISLLLKVLASAVAILLAAFLAPGMQVTNFSAAILAAIVMGIIDWAISKFTGINESRASKGAVGFITGVVIIYLTGKIVDGFTVSFLGAIIGAVILGLVDMVIPGERTYKQ